MVMSLEVLPTLLPVNSSGCCRSHRLRREEVRHLVVAGALESRSARHSPECCAASNQEEEDRGAHGERERVKRGKGQGGRRDARRETLRQVPMLRIAARASGPPCGERGNREEDQESDQAEKTSLHDGG